MCGETGEEAFQGEAASQQRCGGGEGTQRVLEPLSGVWVCAGWGPSLEVGVGEVGGS